MNPFLETITVIVLAIIGVATLALLISPKARTTDVIQAGASGFVNSLATAMSPVTGERVGIVSDYPQSGAAMGFNGNAF